MTLAALQRDFCSWLIGEAVEIDRWIAGTDARVGLDVYHNAYRVQLVECLRTTFEKTLLWIGEDAFLVAARIYIENTPPHGWTLNVYGEGFDRTLAGLHPDDPEVAELAWLDWALSRAFEGPDCAMVDPERLAKVDWDNAVLRLVPTKLLGPARTNAGAIWSALAADEEPPAAALLPTPGAMLIWRQRFTPCFRTIGPVEGDALALIETGASFGMLCAALADRFGQEDGVTQAGRLLGQWIRDGLLAAAS